MDAITLLKQDHRTVEKLFKQFEKAGDNAHKTKRKIVDQVIEELARHAAIEEQVFYPAVRDEVKGVEDLTLEALEEHHVVKWTLSELEGMSPEHERFTAKMTVLMESVRHHVEEEEGEMFPEVRKALGRKRLGKIGDQMESLKGIAPTRPHPKAPDEPPANLIANTGAGAADQVRSSAKKARKNASKSAKKALSRS
jgi:hemerythrin superfamily protein